MTFTAMGVSSTGEEPISEALSSSPPPQFKTSKASEACGKVTDAK